MVNWERVEGSGHILFEITTQYFGHTAEIMTDCMATSQTWCLCFVTTESVNSVVLYGIRQSVRIVLNLDPSVSIVLKFFRKLMPHLISHIYCHLFNDVASNSKVQRLITG